MIRDGIVDAHHHLWVRARHPQDWIDPTSMAAIDADFTPDDLAAATSGHGIEGTVVVQSVSSTSETLDLLDVAAGSSLVRGVVGWVDVRAPDVPERLARLRAARGGDRLVGIRYMVQAEADPRFLDRDDVRRGIAAVAADDLVFDLVVRDHQLAAVVRLVEAQPQSRFVLDHLGKPPLADGHLATWSADLARLASCPNVSAKLSGLVTEARWDDWTPRDLRPAVDHALETFGADRLLYGSDWPVSLLAASYGRWVEALDDLLAGLSPAEQHAVWQGTARRVYGLPSASPPTGSTPSTAPAAGEKEST
ncbi:amidohydrolase family protein [Oerskovia flava]|uniref:amidohydrolase family protein n=1 Tax=Oerskovia flava TaxID=2986422 RepID=UPI00223F57FF|nr:amidohydrolase family protein [Oerskovia sp. JB1-3-2]